MLNTDNCSWTWTTIDGINGYKVQSKKSGYTDNWIFLPAAGYRDEGSLINVGSRGFYWSSSLYMDYMDYGFDMHLYLDYVDYGGRLRFNGQSIRPVLE